VDEEHDSSFKQHDPAPRYHARDAAIVLAGLHGAKTILGTATPAIETYFNALSGKYGLVELTERYGGVSMPEILLANIREELMKRTMQSHFTSQLVHRTREAMQNGEQVILFQNRRGFSPHLACDACDWIPMCRHCDISLTYHKRENRIQCHYCGYSEPLPNKCPQCGSSRILMKGFGTEKVEEELQTIFPETVIRRMDLDSTRTKFGHHRIITEFEERRIQILVGTQMVTKGLDFDNVSVVGILNADSLLNYPDFRSHERSFQLMEQVSGRAGRKSKQGKVIIQSYNPSHPVIQFVVRHDYKGFFESQMADRNKFHYPPYYRLIILKLKHKDFKILNKAAGELATDLRGSLGKRVLGPEYPLVSRIRNLYIKQIMVKMERGPNAVQIKDQIKRTIDEFQKMQVYRQVRVIVDVDPQ
jgi:primosomal protein N' (replication factor Y)